MCDPPYSGYAVEHDSEGRGGYADGILTPTRESSLKDEQRVRLTVETIHEPAGDREAAIARLITGIASMRSCLEGPLPSREELHERR
jgi:hypothetical protein